MFGRDKRAQVLIGLVVVVLVFILVFVFVVLNQENNSKADSKRNISIISSTTNRENSFPNESTTTALTIDGISLSLSTPTPNQEFTSGPIPVRAIIGGTTSGTCDLKFTKIGTSSFNVQAPVVTVTSYSTCEGFDIDPNRLASKGEWILELTVTTPNGKSISEKRKIILS